MYAKNEAIVGFHDEGPAKFYRDTLLVPESLVHNISSVKTRKAMKRGHSLRMWVHLQIYQARIRVMRKNPESSTFLSVPKLGCTNYNLSPKRKTVFSGTLTANKGPKLGRCVCAIQRCPKNNATVQNCPTGRPSPCGQIWCSLRYRSLHTSGMTKKQ